MTLNVVYVQDAQDAIVVRKRKYRIAINKDGKFYVGYCLEIPQARGQGYSKAEAVKDTKLAVKLGRAYLEDKMKNTSGP